MYRIFSDKYPTFIHDYVTSGACHCVAFLRPESKKRPISSIRRPLCRLSSDLTSWYRMIKRSWQRFGDGGQKLESWHIRWREQIFLKRRELSGHVKHIEPLWRTHFILDTSSINENLAKYFLEYLPHPSFMLIHLSKAFFRSFILRCRLLRWRNFRSVRNRERGCNISFGLQVSYSSGGHRSRLGRRCHNQICPRLVLHGSNERRYAEIDRL